MSLKLFGYWRSSATYRVRIALHLKQLEYEYIPVHLVKAGGEQFSDQYHGLNPAHLVPTFVDDDEDIILNQSMAIIEYIDERYQQNVNLIPKHKTDRARVRMVSQDVACDIQPVANLRVLKHLQQGYGLQDPDKVAWCNHWMSKGFTSIERRLQTTAGDYCFGFDITMADVFLIPQVYNAQRFKLDMSEFPIINRIYHNCNQLEPFIAAAPENQIDAE